MITLWATDCEDNYSSLIMYKDYTFTMHIATKKTCIFYYKLKLCLTIMNIVLSASLSVIDGTFINNVNDTKLLENRILTNMNIVMKSGMVINFILCITMGLMYLFEVAQKEVFFRIYSENYLRLHNTIVTEISLNKTCSVNRDFIKFIMFEYNFLVENAKYEIPTFIKRRTKMQFQNMHIPSYLDVYINNFKYQSSIKKFKDYIYKSVKRVTKKQIGCEVPAKSNVSPMIKSYTYDSHDSHDIKETKHNIALSSVVLYDNGNSNSNISPLQEYL